MPAGVSADDLNRWVLETAPRAVAYARSLLKDIHHAEDVVQECYCRLLAKGTTYDLPRDGLKLLLTAITNATINLKTRRKPMFRLYRRNDATGEEIADDHPDAKAIPAENLAIGLEVETAIGVALQRLPTQQRAAVELKSLGYSQLEIAEILGVSQSNAGVLIHRARQALAELLKPYLGEEALP